MRDQLKNEFLLLLNMKVPSEDLRVLSTELIPYGSDIPKTVEIAHRYHLQKTQSREINILFNEERNL